jgi:hypothetical protein
VGEHRVNGFSQAKAAGQQIIKVADLGDEFALKGVRLETVFDTDKEHLCVLLVVEAGKNSRLVGLQVVPTVVAELARIKISDLKAGIAEAISPKVPEQPA